MSKTINNLLVINLSSLSMQTLNINATPFYPRRTRSGLSLDAKEFFPEGPNPNVTSVGKALMYYVQCSRMADKWPAHMLRNAVGQFYAYYSYTVSKTIDHIPTTFHDLEICPEWLFNIGADPKLIWEMNKDLRKIPQPIKSKVMSSTYFAESKKKAFSTLDFTSVDSVREFIYSYSPNKEETLRLFSKTRTYRVIQYLIARDVNGEMLKSYLSVDTNPRGEIYRAYKKNPRIFSPTARTCLNM